MSFIMQKARVLIVCKSTHHQNTAKVARAMADVLDATIITPEEMPGVCLGDYDLIGFGSGVYYGRLHPALYDSVRGLPDAPVATKSAFIFSTSGLSFLWKAWHGPLKRELGHKGFDVVGEFHCSGFDSWGPLWLAGGLNRRHPDKGDLVKAEEFAGSIASRAFKRSSRRQPCNSQSPSPS